MCDHFKRVYGQALHPVLFVHPNRSASTCNPLAPDQLMTPLNLLVSVGHLPLVCHLPLFRQFECPWKPYSHSSNDRSSLQRRKATFFLSDLMHYSCNDSDERGNNRKLHIKNTPRKTIREFMKVADQQRAREIKRAFKNWFGMSKRFFDCLVIKWYPPIHKLFILTDLNLELARITWVTTAENQWTPRRNR